MLFGVCLGRALERADEKLGPERRIKRRKDFLRIQEKGHKYRSQHFLLAVCPAAQRVSSENTQGSSENRLGLTVTTKVDKRAVARNRLKRRLREIFRRRRRFFRRTVDLVIIARMGSTQLSFSQVLDEITFLFERANLIAKKSSRNAGKNPPNESGLRETRKC